MFHTAGGQGCGLGAACHARATPCRQPSPSSEDGQAGPTALAFRDSSFWPWGQVQGSGLPGASEAVGPMSPGHPPPPGRSPCEASELVAETLGDHSPHRAHRILLPTSCSGLHPDAVSHT